MATQSKTQLLTNVHSLLKRRYKPKADRSADRLTVLKAVVYGICHEDTTREQANQALSRFEDEFYDWNEVRVSSVEEIEEVLAGIPHADERAQRIRRFLRQLFNRTYGFSLDALAKKPLKEALKVLQTYEAFSSDYVTATVVQQALGGHAIPIDNATRRVLERLGLSEPSVPALRSVLERAIPKNRGVEFLDLLENLATDTCVDGQPDCPRCELRKICTFALTHKSEPQAAAPSGRSGAARQSKDGAASLKGKTAAPKPLKKTSAAKPPKESPPSAKSRRSKHGGPK
jgi:endonuclease III